MDRILQEYLKKNHGVGDIILSDVNEITSILDNLNKDSLYKSPFHGLYHSQKVCFFAYIIGKRIGLNTDDMQIVLDAAKYHDIGREDDSENPTHGFASANRIDKVLTYDNLSNMYYLKAIMDAHSVPDDQAKRIFDNWDDDFRKIEDDNSKRIVEGLDYNRFKLLLDILKDADALDRLRFGNLPAGLNKDYLRTNAAKDDKLIDAARIINEHYREYVANKKYEIIKKSHDNPTYDKKICYHSVGFDFFKVLSILKNGILSYYNANKNGIELSRNFKGNNSDFWISVIDTNTISEKKEAYEKYVKNGISFVCYVDELVEGVSRSKDNGSFEPRASEEYHDEKFVFDKIPLEHIQFISIPIAFLKTRIDELEYLYCNSNYEVVMNNVNRYLDEIEDYCNVKLYRNRINQILEDFKHIQIEYNSSDYHDKEQYDKYIAKIDHMKGALNIYIQQCMQTGFCELMNKTYEDKITLAEVMRYILHRNGIEYTLVSDNVEVEDEFLSSSNLDSFNDQDSFLLRLSTFDLNRSIYNDDSETSRGI